MKNRDKKVKRRDLVKGIGAGLGVGTIGTGIVGARTGLDEQSEGERIDGVKQKEAVEFLLHQVGNPRIDSSHAMTEQTESSMIAVTKLKTSIGEIRYIEFLNSNREDINDGEVAVEFAFNELEAHQRQRLPDRFNGLPGNVESTLIGRV